VAAERLRKARQGVMANRSDRDPPSLNEVRGLQPTGEMRRGSADSIRASGHQVPQQQAGYKTAIRLPVAPKSVLASREASIQNLVPVAGRFLHSAVLTHGSGRNDG